ncbi:MAG: HAD family hydrolase [Candidatus Limnocylindria bacterium]|nr:HAD family hydrolase [Candidatus Limnocylindria bacterium]
MNGSSREDAWSLLCQHTKGDSLRKHGLAVEAVMRHRARAAGLDAATVEDWAITGILHDFDYEADPAGHPQNGRPILEAAGLPAHIVRAIQSHGDHTGVSRDSALEKTLYAVDELSGFVTAVALVRPSRAVRDVDAGAVRRKMKDKAFARSIDREMMVRGAEELGVPFDDLIADVVSALNEAADRLGLAGSPA